MTEQMDFANIVRQILRQWAIIIMLGAIAALGCDIAASRMYRPEYGTSAIIVVYGKSTYSTGAKKAEETAEVFQEIVTSRLLQKKVAEAMGMTSLPGTISCRNIPKTNMITLSVRAGSPRDVMTVINGVLEHYDEVTEKLLGDMVLHVLEEPQVPEKPLEPYSSGRVLKKVFLLVTAGVSFLLFLYFYLRDDIKNETQVERKLDTRLFGTIYHEKMQKGFRLPWHRKKKTGILVNNPVTSFGYVETFQKLCMKLEYSAGKKHQKIILITSVLENEGKSTVAVNLALSLAKRGKKVLLVDGDLRKPAQFKLLNQTYEKGEPQIGSVLSGRDTPKEAIRTMGEDNLFLLAGSRSYKNAAKLITSRRGGEVIGKLGDGMDYVILDTPPLFMAAEAEELMRGADAGLLVVRQNCSRTRDINDAIDIFKKSGCHLLGCVFNDVKTGIIDLGAHGGDGYQYKYGHGYSYYRRQEEGAESEENR